MTKPLKYFSYVSQSKVDQLYEQITEFSVSEKTTTETKGTETSLDVGANPIGWIISGMFKRGRMHTNEQVKAGKITSIQKLAAIIEHIEKHEKLGDLAESYSRQENSILDAFCYKYSGRFHVLGKVYRENKNIVINGTAIEKLVDYGEDEIVLSKKFLLDPGYIENSTREVGPNNSKLVSDFCIITSRMAKYSLELTCSYKYFSHMGGNYDEAANEWIVHPHSANANFFAGNVETWFETLIFINGVVRNTIMGSPLYLAFTFNPTLRI